MKAKYKEKLRLILIDNKLSIEEKNAATDNVVEEMALEFAGAVRSAANRVRAVESKRSEI
jgi:hypothetical protein